MVRDMRNIRYLIKGDYSAEQLAEDLRVQLDINRQNNVRITPVKNRNEVIVQVPEASGSLEEIVGSFMQDYHSGVILE
jgi:menaquinone-dependent protoporphyrinogen IX oxidase